LNGGTCKTSGSSYVCSCLLFYSGTNCQTCIQIIFKHEKTRNLKQILFKKKKDTNACLSSPCQNGAVCQAVSSGFSCVCPLYYSGTFCQICNHLF